MAGGVHKDRWVIGGEVGMGPGGQELGKSEPEDCGIHRSPLGPHLPLSVQPSVFVPTFLMAGTHTDLTQAEEELKRGVAMVHTSCC